ncbi:PqiC family protein [Geminicoccus roseus]|uniref:PqiC family protein n=1 Tax=Geminicoccus roseus TaxID=404900 RepID=UPI0003F95E4C|nr:PqiC family protein [Geminicoccus roseus]
MIIRPIRLAAAALLLASVVSACSSTAPTRYYQMIPVAEPSHGTEPPTRLLAIAPIRFPEYLDRPQIVTRADATRISVAEFDQWSEPLGGMFADVLVENFRRKLGGEHVMVLPDDRAFDPTMELDLNVLRFDVDAAGQITLDTRWRLLDERGDLLTTERSDIVEQATPDDYDSIVDGMSRAVGALVDRIAMTIPAAVEQAASRGRSS